MRTNGILRLLNESKMIKDEYIKEKNLILSKIDELKKDLKVLESQYIETNSPFEIGELVLVTNGETSEKGFVDGYEVDWSNDIIPIIKKIKKDGSKSQHKIWVWTNSTISKIN